METFGFHETNKEEEKMYVKELDWESQLVELSEYKSVQTWYEDKKVWLIIFWLIGIRLKWK